MGKPLEIGDLAPLFVGRKQNGELVSLQSYRGKYLVLYFYTKSFTPGCTQQARLFRDNYPELRALGAEVLGVSTDDVATQCEFAEKNHVTFPLIADRDQRISISYDALRPLLRLDKRLTFVIDPSGRVVFKFQHQFQVSKHLDQVVAFLKEAQIAQHRAV